MHKRHLSALLAITVAALVLGGCVPQESEQPGASGRPTPGATAATGSPTPTGAATPAPDPESSVAFSIACDQLISPNTMYEFSPLFALESSFSPAAGTLAARAIEYQGTGCRWVHETSGETIVISVAQLTDTGLSELSGELSATSTPATEYGAEGYFDTVGGAGQAQLITGSFWITATSEAFFEPADAQPLVAAAAASVG